jgi:hypothetical protein
LAPLALASLIVSIVTIAALAGLRFLAEQQFGLPELT